jgi:predicted dehydrogenase
MQMTAAHLLPHAGGGAAALAAAGAGPLRVLVVGCGTMGTSHARGYAAMPDSFAIVGLVSRGDSKAMLAEELGLSAAAQFGGFEEALAATRPHVVCISTYPDTHEEFAVAAFAAGCHVFLEKPIAPTVAGAERVVAAAAAARRKLLVGYILRVHPAWTAFVAAARGLGSPLVMRMNLNQQDQTAEKWAHHKRTMQTVSPIVDCGVHYVDVFCQMVPAGVRPVRVSGIGARLTDELADPAMYNYGQLQVTFDDGSVGWYEAGWGPMMSETAFFVKDVVGPA